MTSMNRRNFLAAGAASTLAGATAVSAAGAAKVSLGPEADRHVYFTGDGVPLTPRQWSVLLEQITAQNEFSLDSYSVGGPIAEMEEKFARLLGKEAAIFFGSGTQANQIAVRTIAGSDTKVLVPRESHYYADSVDCGPVLSNHPKLMINSGGPGVGFPVGLGVDVFQELLVQLQCIVPFQQVGRLAGLGTHQV